MRRRIERTHWSSEEIIVQRLEEINLPLRGNHLERGRGSATVEVSTDHTNFLMVGRSQEVYQDDEGMLMDYALTADGFQGGQAQKKQKGKKT